MNRKTIASLIGGMLLAIEFSALVFYPQESKRVMRTVYDWLWSVAPLPEGMSRGDVPRRFE